jgi:inorganic pyrophosphatase
MPRGAGFAKLPPWNDDDGTVTVVIETPKGSRNKFAYDEERGIFELKKVLPAGMGFPYDFGFVPSTLAGDGDPIDVLVLMDEPAFPGCVLRCRLIGVIEGEQIHHGKRVRNDRLIGIEINTHSFAAIKTLRDLDGTFLDELKAFFVNYHSVSPREYRILDVRGPRVAAEHVDESVRRRNHRMKKRGQSAA